MVDDLRQWLVKMDKEEELKRIDGADWDEEIGCATSLNRKAKGKALLFDNIKDYPPGFRIVTGTLSTSKRVALTLGIPYMEPKLKLIEEIRQWLPKWYANMDAFQPQQVKTGPVLENVLSGEDVDILRLPAPKWHPTDGGRYIGTADAVITKDPDTGVVNLGTYRVMVHDRNTLGLNIEPGQHGRIQGEKYHATGQACPVAVSLGHHPITYLIASTQVPEGTEYPLIGAIMNEPVNVIIDEVTGLPIPADSEIVLVGWCPPGEMRDEGTFGEWTGHFCERAPKPIIKVERMYYRNSPIILGQPPEHDFCVTSLFKSAALFNDLVNAGVPDVKAVYFSDISAGMWVVISIQQRYAGHAKRAAMTAITGGVAARYGRYIITVDEDVDPSDIEEVIRAICFRVDPRKDIDIIRDCWSGPTDPIIRRPAEAFSTSRAVINACRPYEWQGEFPKVVADSPDVVERVRKKWGIG